MKVRLRMVFAFLVISAALAAGPMASVTAGFSTWLKSCQYVSLDYKTQTSASSYIIWRLGGTGCWNASSSWFTSTSVYYVRGANNIADGVSWNPPPTYWSGSYRYADEYMSVISEVGESPVSNPMYASFGGHMQLRVYPATTPNGTRWGEWNWSYSNSVGYPVISYNVQNWSFGAISQYWQY